MVARYSGLIVSIALLALSIILIQHFCDGAPRGWLHLFSAMAFVLIFSFFGYYCEKIRAIEKAKEKKLD